MNGTNYLLTVSMLAPGICKNKLDRSLTWGATGGLKFVGLLISQWLTIAVCSLSF